MTTVEFVLIRRNINLEMRYTLFKNLKILKPKKFNFE